MAALAYIMNLTMDRQCGECTLCCLVPEVPEMNKPINTMCKHCDKGCTIWPDRPKSCRAFDCAWLRGAMNDDMRPDKSHVAIEVLPDERVVLALIEPGYDHILSDLNEPLSEFTDRGVSIVASNGRVRLGNGSDMESVRNAIMNSAKDFGVI